MAQQTIDTSTQTDLLFQGFEKVNNNFTEVYSLIIQTGMMIDYWGFDAPSGWVLADGLTIGSASSSATGRANSDTLALFTLLWNSLLDTEAPVSGGRGISAAADFSSNKTITIPDLSGRVSVGKGSSGTFTTLGQETGDETHILMESELPSVAGHSHFIGDSIGVQAGSDFSVTSSSGSGSSTSSGGGFGSGLGHNNIQPSIVCNKIIKL